MWIILIAGTIRFCAKRLSTIGGKMNQTLRFVKTCGKFEISAIFGALQNRIVPAINMIHIYENNIYI